MDLITLILGWVLLILWGVGACLDFFSPIKGDFLPVAQGLITDKRSWRLSVIKSIPFIIIPPLIIYPYHPNLAGWLFWLTAVSSFLAAKHDWNELNKR